MSWWDAIVGLSDLFGSGAEAVEMIDPELLTLAQNDPTMAFELANLGDTASLGFGVGENASDFGLTPGSTQTVGEATTGLNRLRAAAPWLGRDIGLPTGGAGGATTVPMPPAVAPVAPGPEAKWSVTPAAEPLRFTPMVQESGRLQEPRIGLERVLAQSRSGAETSLPEAWRRLVSRQTMMAAPGRR